MGPSSSEIEFTLREFRIYISAPIPDLQRERLLLHSKVFPKLKKFCKQRRISFQITDLRVGEFEERRVEEQILNWCFFEIDRCRPYFLGILGDYYGFVPEDLPQGLSHRYPWIKGEGCLSVNEIEILHGPLNSQKNIPGTFFYFRSPDWKNQLSEDDRKPMEEGPSPEEIRKLGPLEASRKIQERAKRLSDLKERIRNSKFPVKDYSSPEEFADFVEKDLLNFFQENVACELDEGLFQFERDLQERYAQAHEDFIFPEKSYFDEFDKHVLRKTGPLFLVGPEGSGKTTLLAKWVNSCRKKGSDIPLIFHSCNATPLSGELPFLLRRISWELTQFKLGNGTISSACREVIPEFQIFLSKIPVEKKVVLVIDDADLFDPVLEIFEDFFDRSDFPIQVRVIFSRTHALRKIKPGWRVIDVQDLGKIVREDILNRFCRQNSLELNPSLIETMLNANQTKSFLFLGILLKEIKRFSGIPDFSRTLESHLECTSPANLMAKILKELLKKFPEQANAIREALNLICFSGRGLQELEIGNILLSQGSVDKISNSKAFREIEPWLINSFGLFNPFHSSLRKVVKSEFHPSTDDEKRLLQTLADYYFTQDLGPRVIDELPALLRKSGKWQKLHSLLTDPFFLTNLWQVDPLHMNICLELVERNSDYRLGRGISSVLKTPERYFDQLPSIIEVLEVFEYFVESASLRQFLCDHYREKEDWVSFGEQALRAVKPLVKVRRCKEAISFLSEAESFSRKEKDFPQVIEILLKKTEIFHDQSKFDETLKILKEAQKIAREIKDWNSLGICLELEAKVHYRKMDLDHSLECFKAQEALCREHNKKYQLVNALSGQALVLRIRGELDTATSVLKETEKLCREINNRDGLQKTLNQLALIFRTRGELGGALQLFGEAEQICREINHRNGLQMSLGGQSQIFRSRGDLDIAMRLFGEQEKICRELGIKEGLQIALGGQAIILKDRGQLSQAMDLAKEAERICRELDYKEGLQRILGSQAMIFKDKGDLDGAMTLLRESEKICRQLGMKSGLQRILEYLAQVLKARGDLDGAMSLLREQERICRELGIKVGLQVALGNQAHILYFRGDLGGAMTLYQEQEAICRELGLKDRLQISLGGQAIIHRARANFKKSVELLKEQERICLELGLKSGLQISLFNQGIIKLTQGHLEGALELFQEQERICREAGYREGLQAALGSQAVIKKARGDLKGSMTLFKAQEKICVESGYKEGLQVSLCGQAAILIAEGALIQALTLLEQGEKICRDLSHKEGLQRILCSKAMVLRAQGDSEGAMELLQEAEKLCRSLDYQSGLQRILENQAVIMLKRGNSDEAMVLLQEQERICRESGIRAGLQASLGQQAAIFKSQGDFEKALRLLKEQESLCREIGLKAGLARSMANQAEIMGGQMENLRDALFLVAKAFRLAQDHGLSSLATHIRGILKTVRAQFVERDSSWKGTPDLDLLKNKLSEKAQILHQNGKPNIALDELRSQEKMCRETGRLEEVASSLCAQAQIHRDRGDFEGALKLQEEAAGIFQQTGNKSGLAEAITNQALMFVLDLDRPNDAFSLVDEVSQIALDNELSQETREVIDLIQDLVLSRQIDQMEDQKENEI